MNTTTAIHYPLSNLSSTPNKMADTLTGILTGDTTNITWWGLQALHEVGYPDRNFYEALLHGTRGTSLRMVPDALTGILVPEALTDLVAGSLWDRYADSGDPAYSRVCTINPDLGVKYFKASDYVGLSFWSGWAPYEELVSVVTQTGDSWWTKRYFDACGFTCPICNLRHAVGLKSPVGICQSCASV